MILGLIKPFGVSFTFQNREASETELDTFHSFQDRAEASDLIDESESEQNFFIIEIEDNSVNVELNFTGDNSTFLSLRFQSDVTPFEIKPSKFHLAIKRKIIISENLLCD